MQARSLSHRKYRPPQVADVTCGDNNIVWLRHRFSFCVTDSWWTDAKTRTLENRKGAAPRTSKLVFIRDSGEAGQTLFSVSISNWLGCRTLHDFCEACGFSRTGHAFHENSAARA